MPGAHAARTCLLCSGTRIQHARSVGVGNVHTIRCVIFVMVGLSSNGNILIVNALMLNEINLLHAMLATPLRQLPTPLCLRPPRGPYLPCLLPFPLPLIQRDRGKGARLLVLVTLLVDNINEPRVSSPTSMPSRGHGEGGRDTPNVGNGEREASPTSLASAGGREKPPRSQPDTLDEKLNSSPTKLSPNRPSTRHVDDWDDNGAYSPPSPTSLHPCTKRKREERGRPTDQARVADFYEKSARRLSAHRERPRPHSRDRHVAPACPPAVSSRAGSARKEFAHPLGPNPPLRCAHRVRQTCGPPAKQSYPPQLCRQLSLATNSSPQSLLRAGTGHAARSIPAPAAAQG